MYHLQFIYPWILWGLWALLIPIVIHLFNFRRYRKVFFSNTSFLQDIKKRTQSSSRLRHLLVLIARLLAIASLVLAFAQPYWVERIQEEKNSIAKQVDFYIDNSFSMKAQVQQGTLLDRAVTQVLRVAESFPDDYQFNIWTNDDAFKTLSLKQLTRHLQHISFSSTPADGAMILQNIAQDSSISDAYLFSDFQKNSFPLECFEKDSVLPINLVVSSRKGVQNISVDSCFVLPMNDNTLKLVYLVTNHSEKYISNLPVKLLINDSVKTMATISIDSGKTLVDSLTFSVADDSLLRGQIVIDDYPITFDNVLNFVIHIRQKHSVLFIQEAGVSPDYFQSAFSLPSFVTKTISPSEVNDAVLRHYNLLVLKGVPELTQTLSEQIEQYVYRGGQVVFLPSKDGRIVSYNAFLEMFHSLTFSNFDTTSVQVQAVEKQAAVYKKVFAMIPPNAQMPVVKTHLPIAQKGLSYSLLKADNGDDLVTGTKDGQGRLFVFSFPMTSDNDAFFTSPLFFPLAYNMATGNQFNTALYYCVGQSVDIKLPVSSSPQPVSVQNLEDSNRFIPYQRLEGEQVVMKLQHNKIAKAGFYIFKQGENNIDYCAFNNDRKESNMQFNTTEEITHFLEKNKLKNYTVITNVEPATIVDLVKQQREGIALWRWFVIVALLALFIEILLLKMKL